MITIKQVLSVCVIILCLVTNPINSQCRTPHKSTGICISVRECKTMLDYLRSIKSKTPKIMEILKGYECGYGEKYVMVCCPSIPIPQNELSNLSTSTETNPNKVNNQHNKNSVNTHPNINLLPRDCGPLPGTNLITKGTKTALFEFPWMALLQYRTVRGLDFNCGGTVINDRYILTAAHCIRHLPRLQLIGVRCGEYNISSSIDCETDDSTNTADGKTCAPPVQDMKIEEKISHPDYNPFTYINDIGLIRLSRPLNMSIASVKPICLPIEKSLQNINFTATKLTVTGWGVTEDGHKSADLLKVEIPVISPQTCQSAYKNTTAKIGTKQICAGGHNGMDSCSGDSGGPLQRIDAAFNDARFVQYGIVSFGLKRCGREGFPGVYTRTDSYLNWILDNIRP